ncbi:MAG: hypothetical protein ACYCWW_10085 [Deltaproteobacteria bacterium]
MLDTAANQLDIGATDEAGGGGIQHLPASHWRHGGALLHIAAGKPHIGGDVIDVAADQAPIGGDHEHIAATTHSSGGVILHIAARQDEVGGDAPHIAANEQRGGGVVATLLGFSPPLFQLMAKETASMPKDFLGLVNEARRELHLDYRGLARVTGLSLRTIQRHHGLHYTSDAKPLIVAVHPTNPALAHELALACGTSLEAMGLVQPKAAPPPPEPPRPAVVLPPEPVGPPPARSEHADTVLLAAATALSLPPEAVRPAVAAALARAAELGVDVKGLAEQLTRPPSTATPEAAAVASPSGKVSKARAPKG